jgi:hypothetical protein
MIEFEEIRPYTDEEYPMAIQQLANDKKFIAVIEKLYPQPGVKEAVLQKMVQMKSISDFQNEIVYPLVVKIEKGSTDGLFYKAMDQFHPEENYLFISNHRDIILDSAFLNSVMHTHGFRKTEIAIGDNLLIYDWIKVLVRLNRSFIVKRNLGMREQLMASKELSAYIRYAIKEKKESIWLAQREGRSKNGNDQTHPALLKMLNMSNRASIIEGFRELNIVPMAISYEIEPCGIAKVEELLNKKHNPNFSKTQQDDLNSMANGVMSPKGRVQVAFGNPLNIRLDEITKGKKDSEIIETIADYINRRIYFNYKLWPNNYIAYDLLNNTQKYSAQYTEDQKQGFVARMEAEIAKLTFDQQESREYYLAMYANPVVNYEKYFGNE